jgi:hypothetical protein
VDNVRALAEVYILGAASPSVLPIRCITTDKFNYGTEYVLNQQNWLKAPHKP